MVAENQRLAGGGHRRRQRRLGRSRSPGGRCGPSAASPLNHQAISWQPSPGRQRILGGAGAAVAAGQDRRTCRWSWCPHQGRTSRSQGGRLPGGLAAHSCRFTAGWTKIRFTAGSWAASAISSRHLGVPGRGEGAGLQIDHRRREHRLPLDGGQLALGHPGRGGEADVHVQARLVAAVAGGRGPAAHLRQVADQQRRQPRLAGRPAPAAGCSRPAPGGRNTGGDRGAAPRTRDPRRAAACRPAGSRCCRRPPRPAARCTGVRNLLNASARARRISRGGGAGGHRRAAAPRRRGARPKIISSAGSRTGYDDTSSRTLLKPGRPPPRTRRVRRPAPA